MKKYNPLTGTHENYNIITHEWEESFSGGGLVDTLTKVASNIASKLTSDTAKRLGETATKSAIESASKKAGDELGKYAVERITPRKRPSIIDPNLIVKELQNNRNIESPKVKHYRGGSINKIFKKYNI